MPKSNQNQPTSQKEKLTVDLSANHAKEEKIKEQKQLESEIERIGRQISSETKKTFDTDENEALDEQVLAFKKAFEERKASALQTLAYLNEKKEELIKCSRELSQIKVVDPQQLLNYVKSLPFYQKTPLTQAEEAKFLAIEEALCNTAIIQSMPSQVIEYQLGVLGREENRKYFSKALFNCLTVTRVEQVGHDYTFIKINNARYKATPSEMCQLAHEKLLKDKNYELSILAFQERLEGIEFEMLQNCFEKLAEKDLDFMEDFEQSTMSEEEKVRKMSELEVLTTPFEERPKEGQTKENITDEKPKKYSVYVCTGNEIKYLEAPISENKAQMDVLKQLEEVIPKDKKNQNVMHAITQMHVSEDVEDKMKALNQLKEAIQEDGKNQDVMDALKRLEETIAEDTKNKEEMSAIKLLEHFILKDKKNQIKIDDITPIPLEKIMQASLSTVSAPSKEVTLQSDQRFIAKLSAISSDASHKCHDKMSSSYTQEYTYVVDDTKSKIKTLFKDHEKEKKKVEECQLEGEALTNAYFKKIDREFEAKLSKRRDEIKQAYKSEFPYLCTKNKLKNKSSEENSKDASIKAKDDLKNFVLEQHPGEEILVCKNALVVKQKQKQEVIQTEQVSQEAIQTQAKRGMALLKTSDQDDDFKKQVNSTVRTSSSFFSASPPSVSENKKDKLSSKTRKVKQKI